jgi:hypothetical protein
MQAIEEQQQRRTLPGMRIVLLVAFLLVLSAGSSLFILTAQTETYFAWTIPALMTAATFGGAYLAAGVLELLASRQHVWANARIAVPAVFVFSVLTLMATLMHLDRFHFNAPAWITVAGTWVWLGVYVVVPIIMAIVWLAQLRVLGVDPPRTAPLPGWLRAVLCLIAAVFVLAGVALFIAPNVVSPLWPWPLTPLTGRAMGAWLVGWGLVMGQMAWENDLHRVRPAFLSLLVLGSLQIVVLARYWNEVAWYTPTAWAYALGVVSVFVIGAYGSFAARRMDRRTMIRAM